MSRRKGRIIAFQALYSWDANKQPLEDILSFSWLEKDSEITATIAKSETETNEQKDETEVLSRTALEERTFASLIIAGTIDHVDEIDALIESHLADNWSKDRINKVTLAILRTSIYQMKFQQDANSNVGIIIDEAVNIAKEYGTDDSYKFINAVLDKIGKDESKS